MNTQGLYVPPDGAMQFEVIRPANRLSHAPEHPVCIWVMSKVKETCTCGCGCKEMYPVYRDSIPMPQRMMCPRTGPGRGGYACDCMGRIIE